MPSMYPCDQEEPAELSELRELIAEYDDLFELLMDGTIDIEETKTLNGIHEALAHKEEELWGGVSDEVQFLITDDLGFDFAMIRHTLGILPDLNTIRRNK